MIEDERDIDLFAGPGGWDEGAAGLAIRLLGIEWDPAACATRRARGHETLQADVSQLDPQEFAPVRLMIASAPCQAFSMAGLGQARKALEAYVAEIRSMMAGHPIDRERLDAACADERGHLVLEPLRWALAVRPRFVACEQVEPVLPLWEAMAAALREVGYGTWTGMLSAEQYGVPQTRRRAFLLAKLDGEVSPPPATHQRYVAPRVKAKQEESLFDAPEPERIVVPEDRGLLPWVSMAQALGWGGASYLNGTHEHRAERPMSEPALAVMFGARLNTVQWLPDDQVGFPRRADTPSGRSSGSVEIDGTEYRERDFRAAGEPAHALTEKSRSWVRIRANAQSKACERSIDEPAPTIKGGHDTAERVWVTGQERIAGPSREREPRSIDDPSYTIRTGTGSGDPGVGRTPGVQWVTEDPPTHMNTGRDWKAGGSREDAQKIPTSEPAPAFTGKLGGQAQWVNDRHKLNDDDVQAGRGGQLRSGSGRVVQHRRGGERLEEEWSADRPSDAVTSRVDRWQVSEPDGQGAVRVSVQEAAVLQGFPPDYPWQGTRTAQYRQIGDAVPPPWARAILAHLIT